MSPYILVRQVSIVLVLVLMTAVAVAALAWDWSQWGFVAGELGVVAVAVLLDRCVVGPTR